MSYSARELPLLEQIAEAVDRIGPRLGFQLGQEPHTFGTPTTTNRAAAEALRDTQRTGDVIWASTYVAQPLYLILLVWDGGTQLQRWDKADNGWADVTGILDLGLGVVTDSDIPDSITRDSELTAAINAAILLLRGGVVNQGDTLAKLYALIQASSTGASVTVSATAPANPSEGDLWWDTTGDPDAGLKIRVGALWATVRGTPGADGADGTAGADGADGADGDDGWYPLLSVATDGERRVLRLTGWAGGGGTAPTVPTDNYITASGLGTLGNAVDIRGAAGTGSGSGTGLTAEQLARLLPTFPAEGSRDDHHLKFDGDTLRWELDQYIDTDRLLTAWAAGTFLQGDWRAYSGTIYRRKTAGTDVAADNPVRNTTDWESLKTVIDRLAAGGSEDGGGGVEISTLISSTTSIPNRTETRIGSGDAQVIGNDNKFYSITLLSVRYGVGTSHFVRGVDLRKATSAAKGFTTLSQGFGYFYVYTNSSGHLLVYRNGGGSADMLTARVDVFDFGLDPATPDGTGGEDNDLAPRMTAATFGSYSEGNNYIEPGDIAGDFVVHALFERFTVGQFQVRLVNGDHESTLYATIPPQDGSLDEAAQTVTLPAGTVVPDLYSEDPATVEVHLELTHIDDLGLVRVYDRKTFAFKGRLLTHVGLMPKPDSTAIVFSRDDLHTSEEPDGRYRITGIPEGGKRRIYVLTPDTRRQPDRILLESIDITAACEGTAQTIGGHDYRMLSLHVENEAGDALNGREIEVRTNA